MENVACYWRAQHSSWSFGWSVPPANRLASSHGQDLSLQVLCRLSVTQAWSQAVLCPASATFSLHLVFAFSVFAGSLVCRPLATPHHCGSYILAFSVFPFELWPQHLCWCFGQSVPTPSRLASSRGRDPSRPVPISHTSWCLCTLGVMHGTGLSCFCDKYSMTGMQHKKTLQLFIGLH